MFSKPLTIALLSLLGLGACHAGEEELRDTDTVPIGAWTFEAADASQGVVHFHKNDHVMDDEDLHVFGPYGAYQWSPVDPLRFDVLFAEAPVARVEIDLVGNTAGGEPLARFRLDEAPGGVVLRRVESCILACEPE